MHFRVVSLESLDVLYVNRKERGRFVWILLEFGTNLALLKLQLNILCPIAKNMKLSLQKKKIQYPRLLIAHYLNL